ncbi:MAG: DUF885 family protein [Verrucomicrobia bacterium]|jgi:hypothetical protein|nr:DUF885 family protein [Verrucomicrobiota bacterium]MBT7702488.1 DUF885 family protein [Verrucomicrobiota bacterium]
MDNVEDSSIAYRDVLQLFKEWRAFEEPGKTHHAPDYSPAAREAQFAQLAPYRQRAAAIDVAELTRAQRVDLEMIRCEMNGFEYTHRFFRPWERDPCYYNLVRGGGNDIPGWHVPHMHNVLIPEWLKYPLDDEAYQKLEQQLSGIPHLLAQAKTNLVGDHKYFYTCAIQGKPREIGVLQNLAERLGEHHPELVEKVEAAIAAGEDFLVWLEKRHAEMDDCGVGIGIEAYNWSMKHVHRVPYDWHQQEDILQRELDRAWASMALEEHRNRDLEPLSLPKSRPEQNQSGDEAGKHYVKHLRDMGLTELADWADRRHKPSTDDRPLTPLADYSFFHHVLIRNQLPLRPHQVHFFDLYQQSIDEHPIRRHTPLYQTWLFRCEGFATAFEEVLMQSGLEDSVPRARELVHICAAFRAARALGALRVHGKGWTLQQAVDFAVKYTPRGWLKPDGELLTADMNTYLRQPEYGPSYTVGKVQVERLIADRVEQLRDTFSFSAFFKDYFACGMIPASLIRWELTGKDDELKKMGVMVAGNSPLPS